MLELMLTTKRFEAIIEIVHDAWMLDTYDALLRDIVGGSLATFC